MKSLVAVAYPDRETAEQVRNVLVEAAHEGLAELDDAVVVERLGDGGVKLHQLPRVGKAAALGAAGGAAIGLLCLVPLLGAAVGAASMAGGTMLSDDGVDDVFMKDLGARLRPGAAALIALGTTSARDELIDRVKQYGGEVLQTRLSVAEEERLQEVLTAGGAAARA